jgi:predicted DNA binding CopG/RHH family protein
MKKLSKATRLEVRLTLPEMAKLKAIARSHGLDVSTYVRSQLFGGEVIGKKQGDKK